MRFTDYCAEASCTAGRANFITGEIPIRTGLTTVGQAGSPLGMPEEAPTIATVLKSMDYATGQFGKMTSTNFYRPFLASTSSMATSITLMPWQGGTQMTQHTASNADHILQTNVPMRAVTALIVLQQLVFVVSVKIWGTLSDRFFEQISAIDKVSLCNPGVADVKLQRFS